MKCPICGGELKRSTKNTEYGLCHACRKKFRWKDEPEDYELYEPGAKPAKKKKGCLKVIILAVFVFVLFIILISLIAGSDSAETDSMKTSTQTSEETQVDDSVPTEYKNALIKAEQYSENMYMSKQGIYDQLTSEYGEQFSAEAAQYAVDNLQADYNYNALQKAIQYQDQMAMSAEAIRDQLTSEYGEKFTQDEADYAIANLP